MVKRYFCQHLQPVLVIFVLFQVQHSFHCFSSNCQLIGESRVVVPTHLFKVVLAEDIRGHSGLSADQRNPLLLAFIVPNSSKDLETSANGLERYLQLERFLTTLEFVEEKSGFDFFPQLDRNEILQTDDFESILQRLFI